MQGLAQGKSADDLLVQFQNSKPAGDNAKKRNLILQLIIVYANQEKQKDALRQIITKAIEDPDKDELVRATALENYHPPEVSQPNETCPT